MDKKEKILFVCLGNICRSPLAEGLLIHKLNKYGLSNRFHVDSCGTGNWHIGQLPDPRTRKNAESNGVSLTSKCRQITPVDLDEFDQIIAMDKSNINNILKLKGAENYGHKIKLLRDYDLDSPGADVPDPYYDNEEGFQIVFNIVDKCLEQWLKKNAQ